MRNSATPSIKAEFDAAAFVEYARAAQARRRQALNGRYDKTPKNIAIISEAAQAALSSKTKQRGLNKAKTKKPLKSLLFRFQILCERNGIKIPEDYYKDLADHLLEELLTNVHAFGFSKNPDRIVPLTVYQGDRFAIALNDPAYACFRELDPRTSRTKKSIFRETATHHVRDPWAYLEGIKSGEITDPRWKTPLLPSPTAQ